VEKGKDPYEGGMDRGQMVSMAVSVASGAVLGMIISFTVNCTLVEISVNAFFAVYFGILFCLISGWMIYRVTTGEHPRPILLGSFSALVMIAGLLCFFLESNWVVSLSRGAKVPLYSILGIAVTFALLFSIIDLVNYCYGSFSVSCTCAHTRARAYTHTHIRRTNTYTHTAQGNINPYIVQRHNHLYIK